MAAEFREFIHYDRDMEDAVIGACLLEKSAFVRVYGFLTKDCFYQEGNQKIFEAMLMMWEQNHPIDILTVTSRLIRSGYNLLDNWDTSFFVTRTTSKVVSTANLEFHALIIRQLYAERELLKLKYSDNGNGDVVERAEKIQSKLRELFEIRTADDWKDMSTVLFKMYQHMAEVKNKEFIGVPTGFKQVDYITGGFAKTQLIAIGARPSVGKSALMAGITLHAASLGYKVGIISLEMPDVQIGARMASMYSGMDFYKIYRNILSEGDEDQQLYQYVQQMIGLPIMISDKTNVSINDIRSKASRLVAKNKMDLLIIDYMQLIEGGGEKSFSREQEVSKMSRGLKLMAMEYNIPVVVLCQLNRETEKSAGKKPQLHHLRESGSIEQDCDGVIFLHRDWKSGITADENGQSTEFEADLIIAKWRNGDTAEIKIGFEPTKMRFYDLNTHKKRTGFAPMKQSFDEIRLPYNNE